MNVFVNPIIIVLALIVVSLCILRIGLDICKSLKSQKNDKLKASVFNETIKIKRDSLKNRLDSQLDGSWKGFRNFIVDKKSDEGGGIASYVLVPEDKFSIPDFKPGQFLTFSLDIETESKPVIRCYSLSDGPNDSSYRVSIKKALAPRDSDFPNGLSSCFFHDHVNDGDVLSVKAPAGDFYLDLNAKGAVVLIAGGVGITPVLSMARALASIRSEREVHFFYGARGVKDLAHKVEIDNLKKTLPNLTIHYCLSAVKVTEPPKEKELGSYYLSVPSLDSRVEIPEAGGVVGRSKELVDIAIDSILISRKHAEITCEDDQWYIRDLESRNGTSVNGEKIGKEKHLLKVDDLIDLSLKKPLQCVFKLEKAVKSP